MLVARRREGVQARGVAPPEGFWKSRDICDLVGPRLPHFLALGKLGLGDAASLVLVLGEDGGGERGAAAQPATRNIAMS